MGFFSLDLHSTWHLWPDLYKICVLISVAKFHGSCVGTWAALRGIKVKKRNLQLFFRRYHCVRKPKQASSPSGLQAELCLPHLASHPTSSQTEDITVTVEKLPEKDKTHQKRLSYFSLHFKNQTSSKMAKATSAFVSVNSSFGADCFSLKCYIQLLPFQSKIGYHQTKSSSWMDQNKWLKVWNWFCSVKEWKSKLQLLSPEKRYCKGRRKRSLKSWVYGRNCLGISFPIAV